MRPAAAIVIACALATAGCGFHPLFERTGVNGGGQQVFNSIYVDPIVDAGRSGYELRNSLINLLEATSRPDQALYHLRIVLNQTLESTAIQTNGYITRYAYNMTAKYHLSNAHTGAELTTGTETVISGYDVVASPYSTLVSQEDAQRSAGKEVADRIRIDLGVYFTKHAGSAK